MMDESREKALRALAQMDGEEILVMQPSGRVVTVGVRYGSTLVKQGASVHVFRKHGYGFAVPVEVLERDDIETVRVHYKGFVHVATVAMFMSFGQLINTEPGAEYEPQRVLPLDCWDITVEGAS